MRKFIILICISLIQGVWAEVSLPSIGVDSAYQLTKEKEIGDKFYRNLIDANKVIKDPLIDFYLKEITHVLLQGLDQNYRKYTVAVIDIHW